MNSSRLLALTVRGEAEGESFEGQLAVAWVILNRAQMFNKSVKDVCLQPYQFSCWNRGSPRLHVMATSDEDDPIYLRALTAALVALTRTLPDPTGGATDYHTISSPPNVDTWPPYWAKEYTPTVRIGAHQFYRRT